MFCRMCGKDVESNHKLRSHLRSDHWMSLYDYYRYFPDATKFCNKCKRELRLRDSISTNARRLGTEHNVLTVFLLTGKNENVRCAIEHSSGLPLPITSIRSITYDKSISTGSI